MTLLRKCITDCMSSIGPSGFVGANRASGDRHSTAPLKLPRNANRKVLVDT